MGWSVSVLNQLKGERIDQLAAWVGVCEWIMNADSEDAHMQVPGVNLTKYVYSSLAKLITGRKHGNLSK